MTSPERITILHISDFHFSGKKLRDQKMVVDALLQDVKSQCVGNKTPDIILFSGDLTNGPPVDEHAAAYDFLLAPLLKATNTTNERLFIVPGNHDVQQDTIIDYKAEHVEWQAKADDLDNINGFFDKGKFQPAHAAKFAKYLNLQAYISGSKAVFENLFCTVTYIEALNTNVVVLNSSMLSTGGHSDFGADEGRMVIPEFAIEEALPYLTDGAFKIFTTHHPLAAFTETGGAYLGRILEKHADLHLFGHMHDPKTKQVIGFEGKLLSNQAGAVFTHRKQWYNGYAIISIDFETGFSRTCLRSYYAQRCQSASKIPPLSASNFAPLVV
ncbi:metallophosphoesterase family protein [Neorhizobium galegae]|uniref:metallophosphoesterase family protein n=1 Tax=Neorhizobium galegae TaxID=399 RepID=UPI001F349F63|nr:metallophosphoesterase [Neorhizobium galegae]UIK06602.1 metallophosphoesterase [Neorhizobium galegae]